MTAIKKILIANRGEVAARIQATAQQLGMQTVCLYAQDDTAQAHLATADEVYALSGSGSNAYCSQEEIISLAHRASVDALHPGYGFLSEVADFARATRQAGFLFIGPSADTIALLGDKGAARTIAEQAQVPVIPGKVFDFQEEETAHQYANSIGYPVVLKAAGGGGGRGMATVDAADEFVAVWHRIGAEGRRSFNTTDIVVEKLVTNARHIEVQIAGDGTQIIHLFERDCSTQRRRQKIIEEAPAYNLPAPLRKQLHAAAVRIGIAAQYRGIGTVEFLVTNTEFYFLEANPRLQVEHGITELITGIDLVALQLFIAEHGTLAYQQHEVMQRGHAIQCRLYTEEVTANFTPCTGTITTHHMPSFPFTHIQHSIAAPYPVTGLYDPMISKVLSWGTTRNEACSRLVNLLKNYRLAGITTNRAFLIHVLKSTDFVRGLTIHSIDKLVAAYQPQKTNLSRLAAAISCAVQKPATTKTVATPARRSYWKEKQWRHET